MKTLNESLNNSIGLNNLWSAVVVESTKNKITESMICESILDYAYQKYAGDYTKADNFIGYIKIELWCEESEKLSLEELNHLVVAFEEYLNSKN